jgi:hypothetical protein
MKPAVRSRAQDARVLEHSPARNTSQSRHRVRARDDLLTCESALTTEDADLQVFQAL